MSDMSDFFGTGGGLWADPPKRIYVPGFSSQAVNTYGDPLAIPCRQAAGRFFRLPLQAAGAVTLVNITTGARIATITPSNVHAGTTPYWTALWQYDEVNGCLYVLALSGTDGSIQLAKIDDTTGAVTKIGAPQAVATVGNWGLGSSVASSFEYGICEFDGAAIKYRWKEVEHSIDLATGAINYQDQSPVLADGTVYRELSSYGVGSPGYVTADRSASLLLETFTAHNTLGFGFAKTGLVAQGVSAPFDSVLPVFATRILRSSTWLAFVKTNTSSSGVYGWRFYDPTDFDRYVQDLIHAAAGI